MKRGNDRAGILLTWRKPGSPECAANLGLEQLTPILYNKNPNLFKIRVALDMF
jgi:hypothetical protein